MCRPLPPDTVVVRSVTVARSSGFGEGGLVAGETFADVDLHGSRFMRADLSEAVMRAVDVAGAEVDAPWLLDGKRTFWVNGVDVVPYVDAELDRRFPGRAEPGRG